MDTRLTPTITIPSEEYKELMAKAERIATVERFLNSKIYVTMDDVKVILGIDYRKENENEVI